LVDGLSGEGVRIDAIFSLGQAHNVAGKTAVAVLISMVPIVAGGANATATAPSCVDAVSAEAAARGKGVVWGGGWSDDGPVGAGACLYRSARGDGVLLPGVEAARTTVGVLRSA